MLLAVDNPGFGVMDVVEDAEGNELVGGQGARFQVLRILGAGGMGEVCLALDTALQRMVAIKTIRRDLSANHSVQKRVERECVLHARVGPHPNIVTLFDKLELDGRLYLVMEYVDGEVLQDRLLKALSGAPLKVSEALSIIEQCLDALAQIHQHGIIHRDIKPSNILLSWDDSRGICAKLMDFGIAYLDDKESDLSRLTLADGVGPGTPLYMSPEQIDSRRYGDVTPLTDIYAMGVLLYEMVSGQPPFNGSFTEIFNGHLNEPVPPVSLEANPLLSDRLTMLLKRALAKEPQHRYPSAIAFRKEVLALIPETAGVRVATPAVVPRASRQAPEHAAGTALPNTAHTTIGREKELSPPLTLSPRGGGVAGWASALAVAVGLLLVAGLATGHFWKGGDPASEYPAVSPPLSNEAPVLSTAQPLGGREALQAAVHAEPFTIDPLPLSEGTAEAINVEAKEEPSPQEPPGLGPVVAAAPPAIGVAAGEITVEGGATYEVQPGDTLNSIAERHGIARESLARWNGLKRPSLLRAGATLLLYPPEEVPDIGTIEWDTPADASEVGQPPEQSTLEGGSELADAAAAPAEDSEPSPPGVQRRGRQVRRLGSD